MPPDLSSRQFYDDFPGLGVHVYTTLEVLPNLKTLDELLTYVESKKTGDTVVLSVVRDGEKTEVPVELEWGK